MLAPAVEENPPLILAKRLFEKFIRVDGQFERAHRAAEHLACAIDDDAEDDGRMDILLGEEEIGPLRDSVTVLGAQIADTRDTDVAEHSAVLERLFDDI